MGKLEKLHNIEARYLLGEDPTNVELKYAFKALDHTDSVEVVTVAGNILMESGKKILLKLIKKVPFYKYQTKIILIPILASSEYVEPYAMMIDMLKKETDDVMIKLLIAALSTTHYPIFPLLLAHLNDENKEFRGYLKEIMKNIGFENIKPALVVFPDLPHESHLRDVFGDDNIESILE